VDGFRFFVAANGGGIYTYQDTPAPILNIAPYGNSRLISWIIPSMDFVLKESADLTNWSRAGVSPGLNDASLNYQVSLIAPTEPRFYCLAMKP